MDWYAPIVRRVIAPLWALKDRNPFLRHYRTVMRTQYDPPDAIRSRQGEALRKLVRHAYQTTRFWKDRFDQAGLRPEMVTSLRDIQIIPLLTKQDLRVHGRELLSNRYPPGSLMRKATSGSTGVPIEVWVHETRQHWIQACVRRADEWSGWRLGERIGAVWGNPEYLKHGWRGYVRNALVDRTCYLDTLKMNAETMRRFLTAMCRRPPSLLFGHAHSLYIFAKFAEAESKNVFRPRAIISTAMVLHQWERRFVERVFRCPVTDRYGCEEVGLIACQCENHMGLHVNADCVYVELLRPDGTPAVVGEPGMIVVTDLVNRAMPILRYVVGDMAVWDERPCPCGRGLPVLKRIEGRVADYVITPRGELISGISLTENFAVLVPGIAQLQIVQKKPDYFLFRIVKAEDFGPASLAKIQALVAERFGEGVSWQCEFVQRIPPEPSGKYRFCISEIPKPLFSQRDDQCPTA